MRIRDLAIYAADIGSIRGGNFGWAKASQEPDAERNTCIEELVRELVADLERGKRIALGFEAPMFVPIPPVAEDLGRKRSVDPPNRAWSAGAGAPVMATGIAQLSWILRELTSHCSVDLSQVTGVRWSEFEASESPALYLWEAMVTGSAKRSRSDQLHNVRDAKSAADHFKRLGIAGVRKLDAGKRGASEDYLSLIGAALVATGLGRGREIELLNEPALVVEA